MKKQFAFVALVCLYQLHALAGETFYYNIVAEAKPTGYGKVYVSTEEENPTDDQYSEYKGTGNQKIQVQTEGLTAVTVMAYLYAKPEEGYMFTHWSRENLKTGAETEFSWSKYTTDLVTTMSTTSDTAEKAKYNAHFAKIGKVYPVSSDEGLGTVTINIPENKVGDEITMTAHPDKLAGRFLGWKFEDSENLIVENPYSFKVTRKKSGTYTAVFESKETATKGIYCYIRNKSTNRTLGVTGVSENTLGANQRQFKHSMMLVPDNNPRIHSIPSLVMKVTGESTQTGGLENVEMISQGISTADIGGMKFRIEKNFDGIYFIFGQYKGFTGYIKDFGGATRTYEYIGQVRTPSLYNRYEDETVAKWVVDIIDEDNVDDNYFGVMPDENCTKDGKYYTTLYTAFPYKCIDGVKAFTVERFTSDGLPQLTQVKDNIVPANTAVILECQSTSADKNRLIPLSQDVDPLTTDNLLKGEIWLDDESGDPDNYRTTFDPATMRILGEGGKFNSTNLTDPISGKVMTYIANNMCYLDISSVDSPAEEMDFTTKLNIMKGDANGDKRVNMMDVTTIINYILAKPVTKFVYDNANVKEDKVINMTDVIGVINIILGK